MSFLSPWMHVFDQIWERHGHHLFKYFSVSIAPSSPSRTCVNYVWGLSVPPTEPWLFVSSQGPHWVRFHGLFHHLCSAVEPPREVCVMCYLKKFSSWFLFIVSISLMKMSTFSFIYPVYFIYLTENSFNAALSLHVIIAVSGPSSFWPLLAVFSFENWPHFPGCLYTGKFLIVSWTLWMLCCIRSVSWYSTAEDANLSI